MKAHLKTPTDHLYSQGVPIRADKLVRGIAIEPPTTSVLNQDVDWQQNIEQDETVDYATASAMSHYHYQNVSHVLLCDKILIDAQNVPEPLEKAATLLVEQCAKDVTAWGTYMKKRGGGGSLPREQREYYQMLFQEDDVLPVLLGIQTKNIAADKSRTDFYRHGDPVFNKIADGTVEENQENLGPLTQSFRDAVQPLSLEQRERLLQKIAQQVDLLQIFCQKRDGDIYKPLNADANRFLKETGTELKKFYNEIGLTQDIF